MDRVRGLVHALREEVCPYDGSGITAAVLDTGIALHPDLAGALIGFRDFVGNSRKPYDDSGHGTHVAGCLCGTGGCSGGRYAGIAPGCRVLVGKVLDAKGDGLISHMEEGIKWVLDNRKLYGIRILNISVSMGAAENGEKRHRLRDLLDRASEEGILVVVAAGNAGPAPGSISPLGESGKVLTVGCCDGKEYRGKRFNCEERSGRGPAGSQWKKPDLVAPGTQIVSCNASFRKTGRGYLDAYTEKSGTSMSTPLAAGAAALCMQKYPDYSAEQVKRRILWNAVNMGEPWNKQGWGLLNVAGMLGRQP